MVFFILPLHRTSKKKDDYVQNATVQYGTKFCHRLSVLAWTWPITWICLNFLFAHVSRTGWQFDVEIVLVFGGTCCVSRACRGRGQNPKPPAAEPLPGLWQTLQEPSQAGEEISEFFLCIPSLEWKLPDTPFLEPEQSDEVRRHTVKLCGAKTVLWDRSPQQKKNLMTAIGWCK